MIERNAEKAKEAIVKSKEIFAVLGHKFEEVDEVWYDTKDNVILGVIEDLTKDYCIFMRGREIQVVVRDARIETDSPLVKYEVDENLKKISFSTEKGMHSNVINY